MIVAILVLGAENAALVGAIWHLLRQGGGVQVKPVPAPKTAPAQAKSAPADLDVRRAA